MKLSIENSYVEVTDRALIEKLIELGAGVEESETLKIPLLEAAYFADKKIISLEKEKILEKARKDDPLTDHKYIILKFLRDRGFITRLSLDTDEYFRVHQKGIRPGEDRTEYVMKVISPELKTDVKEIRKALLVSSKLRKELIIGYVEKDEPHFLKISRKTFD